MSEDIKDIHRKFAVDCFNRTWELMNKTDRTTDEDFKMIHTAHASRYHWGEIGTPLEFARGDWQLARVYAVIGMGKAAYRYSQSSLKHCLDNEIGDFDLAFAYESLARASAIRGDESRLAHFKELAVEAGNAIAQDDDRDYFFSELKTLPG